MVLKNISWLFLDRILRLGVGLVVGVLVARYLGPEFYGKWSYAIAIVSVFSVLGTLGLDSVVVRRIISDPINRNMILGSAFFLRVAGSVFCIVLSLLYVYISDPSNLFLILIIITASSYLFQAFDVIDNYNQSQLISRNTVIVKNASFILVSLLRLLLVLLKAEVILFVYLGLIETIIGSVGLLYFYKLSNFRAFEMSKTYAMDLLKECWPLIFSGIVIIIYMRIDQIMIGRMLGEKAVGVYSAAVKIAEVWYFIPSIIASSVYPTLIKASVNSRSQYHFKIQQLFKSMVMVSLPICVVVFFFSDYIIEALFGVDFKEAANVLIINIWASIFVFLGVASGNVLVINGLKKQNFLKSLLGAVLNIVLNVVFIPRFGIIGAALSTLIAQAFASTFYFFLFKETRFIFYLQIRSLLLLPLKK